jgi:UDP-N-acetylmuramate: L-alanyl-gamma-D-glutamyl-meso-diaminopimelate ligase
MNLKNFWDIEKLGPEAEKIKKIFFYRVCGTGMGAAACLLQEAGYEVEGGDHTFYPPMSHFLENSNIQCHKLSDLSPQFYQQFDLIVVGNVVAGSSAEAREIENWNIPFTSFPAALGGLILNKKNVIGICGTHGKTTTTYYLKQMLENLTGKCPGYMIGGVLDDGPPGYLGKEDYFVIESDEYDSGYFQKISKLRLYQLKNVILTSLEFDHADIFQSVEDIKKQFIPVLEKGGKIFIAHQEYAASLDLFNRYKNRFQMAQIYGGPVNPKIISHHNSLTKFSLVENNQTMEFETNVVGKHNIENLTSIILWCLKEGFGQKEIQRSIKNLKMVKRRQEERGRYREAIVIDDFAHHPRAIDETLKSLKVKYPNKKLIVVVDPSSATGRSDIFQNEYPQSLQLAHQVVIAQPQRKTIAIGRGDLNTEKLIRDWIALTHQSGSVVKTLDELLTTLNQINLDHAILVILSNGTCLGLWESPFVDQLKPIK